MSYRDSEIFDALQAFEQREDSSGRETREDADDYTSAENVVRNPLKIEMPVHAGILRNARHLVGDRNLRIQELATCVSQDPIITLELLRVSNAMFFVQDRAPITNPRSAVIRLGSENIIEILDRLADRPQLENPYVENEFEILRNVSRQVSIVSRILAQRSSKDYAEDAQAIGLMTNIGHLIACAFFGMTYVELSRSLNRVSLVYRLAQDHNFDVRSRRNMYLRKQGIPEVLLFALDPDSSTKIPERVRLKFIVESAEELVTAFNSDKWEKYHPSQKLPNKSAIRLLQLSDNQYEELFEKCDEYLNGSLEEAVTLRATTKNNSSLKSTVILDESQLRPTVDSGSNFRTLSDEAFETRNPLFPDIPQAGDDINTRIRLLEEFEKRHLKSSYAFDSMGLPAEPTFVVSDQRIDDDPPSMRTERAQQLVALLFSLCAECRATDELLNSLLKLLITESPFVRAALIVLSKTRRTAYIHTAIGDGLESGSMLSMNDPLSPLVSCLTKIRSFNVEGMTDVISPLGIMSYAISPLSVENDTPVVLYADCGEDGQLTFDARIIFRMVVGLVNQVLPELPGGLPELTINDPISAILPRE